MRAPDTLASTELDQFTPEQRAAALRVAVALRATALTHQAESVRVFVGAIEEWARRNPAHKPARLQLVKGGRR
jgi:hypothetical protein